MNVDAELADYKAAGALSEEIPYWGWLEDGRTCLTRAGELVSVARLSPAVLDGAIPRTDGRGAESLAADAFRGRYPDPHLLLSVSPALPIRGRRAGRASHRGGALPEETAGFLGQPRENDPVLRCLDP